MSGWLSIAMMRLRSRMKFLASRSQITYITIKACIVSPPPHPHFDAETHLVELGAFFFADGSAGQLQEHVVETGMLDLDRLNAILEVHDDAGHELGARGHLE